MRFPLQHESNPICPQILKSQYSFDLIYVYWRMSQRRCRDFFPNDFFWNNFFSKDIFSKVVRKKVEKGELKKLGELKEILASYPDLT